MATYIQSMLNIFYDMRRDVLSEVIGTLKNKNLFTKEIEDALTEISVSKKTVNKKPRFSGYHLFMKEHRVVVKNEQPGIKPQQLTTIVAKAWKHIPEDEKRELNDRALKMKEAYYNTENDEPVVLKETEAKKKPVARKVRRVSDCMTVLKERFDAVKKVHLLAAARHMVAFLKEHESHDSSDENAIIYAINKVNQQQDKTIFKVENPKQNEDYNTEEEYISDLDSESEEESEDDMRLASESEDSDEDE